MNEEFYVGDDGSWVVQFGEGKIMVMAGHTEVGVGAVSFLSHRDQHKIGEQDPNLEALAGCSTDEVGDDYCPGLRLIFTKPESIDIIIEALQETKKYMIEKTDLTTLRRKIVFADTSRPPAETPLKQNK